MTRWEDGRPVEWVTTVEPEFDDEERESWYALEEWQASLCPHCGNPRVICSNPDGLDGRGFYPQRDVCYVTAARERTQRQFSRLHEKAKPDPAGYLPTDGVHIRASLYDESPEDDFLDEGLDLSDM